MNSSSVFFPWHLSSANSLGERHGRGRSAWRLDVGCAWHRWCGAKGRTVGGLGTQWSYTSHMTSLYIYIHMKNEEYGRVYA